MKPKSNVDSSGTPRIVYYEVGVREFRLQFTGAEAYGMPVEVKAYGRLIGHWFPAGTLPPAVAPGGPALHLERPGRDAADVRRLRSKADVDRSPRPPAASPPVPARHQQRESWLRAVRRQQHG
jgi:hypothetical protein